MRRGNVAYRKTVIYDFNLIVRRERAFGEIAEKPDIRKQRLTSLKIARGEPLTNVDTLRQVLCTSRFHLLQEFWKIKLRFS